MLDQQIDKAQAAVLVENAHGLWIRAKTFVLTHEGQRLRKAWWFTQLARTTLIASIITVVLSAFGFTQDIGGSNSNRMIWLLTALSAVLAAL